MKELLAVALIWASGLFAQSTPAPTQGTNAWEPLRFLIGTWEAKTEGGSAGAAGTGTYSFQLELRNHILARHATSSGCEGPDRFDCEHGDLLYIYQDAPGRPFRAIYFDNEGHVIHYGVSTPTAATAIFLSESSQPGPKFRLIYELKGSIMYGKFQMQMPGQTEFTSYLEWSGAKK